VILNATKISVDMIERLSSDIMKGMPKGMWFGAEQTIKYVILSWARRYFKDTEQAIERGEDRLNPYKGLQSGYNDDAGEAVMHVSNMVRDLIQIKKAQRPVLSTRELERDIFSYMPGTILFPFSVAVS
jgi:hypothetical protein